MHIFKKDGRLNFVWKNQTAAHAEFLNCEFLQTYEFSKKRLEDKK